MFISKIQLKNFKRFTDLTVDLSECAEPPKLVLLIGANGSGKSCIFDAFEYFTAENLVSDKQKKHLGVNYYSYLKKAHPGDENVWGFEMYGSETLPGEYKFYGRTAFRNIAYLDTNRHAGEFGKQKIDTVVEENLDRTNQFIDEDQRWETDIVYACTDNIRREELVSSINNSLNNIFSENLIGKFQIESIKVDIGGLKSSLALEVLIKKGKSIFPYEYLSAGEKQLFAILLNLYLRKKYLENTIVYLDEIDLHLNTAIQCDLLKEITENIIPDNSQLWTASHSLGFIDYARDYNKGAIIDFDNLDFDQAQILQPESKNKFGIFEIAVSGELLAKILDNKKVIFAENTDTGFYNDLKLDNFVFFIANDKRDILYKTNNQENYFGLIDRDYLTDEELESINEVYSKLYVLKYYCFENYLYHPNNLEEYFEANNKTFDKTEYIQQITEEKNKIISQTGFEINVYRARESYSFFKENNQKMIDYRKAFQDNSAAILQMLKENNFETFYKVFSMKDYCKNLIQRQNLNKKALAQTNWFKAQIEEVLK